MTSSTAAPVDGLLDELGLAGESVRRFGWPARPGRTADWPSWLPAAVAQSLQAAGIDQPWGHQVAAADTAISGRHVVLATGTASGKSLGFLLPVLAATYGGPDVCGPSPTGDRPSRPGGLDGLDLGVGVAGSRPHTALYLAPTKALAHDQFRAARELGPPGWRIATLDGDTEPPARDWVRDWGTYVLSNPDMLHHSVLPQHRRWAPLLRRLRYVVVDEAHRYRGVFGSQVAAVLARLRRLAHYYGADPVFVLAAATVAEPAGTAGRLIGVPAERITVVDQDDSARPARELLLVEPGTDPDELTAALLSRSVASGRQTLAFARSRRSAETIALRARAAVAGTFAGSVDGPSVAAGAPPRIEAYRAGYLAEDRRGIEAGLRSGEIRGVASTNALELGVDIAGLDAVLIDGYPGTRSSFWQQAGRAGRAEADALVVLVAGRHPLDRFLFAHPEVLLGSPVEASVLNRANPYVLRPQLLAAARELPLTERDELYFGPTAGDRIAELAAGGALRRRPGGWFATGGDGGGRVDLRAAGRRLDIVESDTGRVIGVIDEAGADLSVHDGAVYLHRGDTYLCGSSADESDWAEPENVPEVLVRAARPGYLTSPRCETSVRILAKSQIGTLGAGQVGLGEVEVCSRVTGYLRRDPVTGTVWDQTPLDLPARTTRTAAVWLTLDPRLVDERIGASRLEAGAHAAEHALLNLLPAYAACDPWDVSGTCAVRHPDTGQLTVLVHDVSAGGAGFAERGFAVARAWLAATAELLHRCDCTTGCPSCVVSATCSTTGRPLDKAVAALLLDLLSSE